MWQYQLCSLSGRAQLASASLLKDCGRCSLKQAAESRCMHAPAIDSGSKGITLEARGYPCCSQHTSGGFESKACSMLRQTIHMLCLWKGDIKRDALWAIGLAVCVALEGFLPPPFRVALLQSWHLALDCCDLWQYAAFMTKSYRGLQCC